jgi:hypothetical protein
MSGRALPGTFIVDPLRQNGYSQKVKRNDLIKFRLDGQEDYHTLTILDVGEDNVRFNLRSEPVTFDLSVGEEKRLDLGGDSGPDVSITLRSIDGEDAVVALRAIAASPEATPQVEIPSDVQDLGAPSPQSVCPTCPECTDWAQCIGDVQYRTCYSCIDGPDSACLPQEEQQDCVSVQAMPTKPRIAVGVLWVLLIAVALILVAYPLVFYRNRRRGGGAGSAPDRPVAKDSRPETPPASEPGSTSRPQQGDALKPLVFDEQKK